MTSCDSANTDALCKNSNPCVYAYLVIVLYLIPFGYACIGLGNVKIFVAVHYSNIFSDVLDSSSRKS